MALFLGSNSKISDFKGVFDISTGSSWGTEPSIVRKGGAGFIVERKGKLIFPS